MGKQTTVAGLAALAGTEIGQSAWLEIDQTRINRFAEATDDFQWIHVDVERANREMGGTIAHGYLTLSLMPMLAAPLLEVTDTVHALNYGLNKVRFLAPVRAGNRVRILHSIGTVEPKGANGMQVTNLYTVEIEGGERPACVAESLILYYGPEE